MAAKRNIKPKGSALPPGDLFALGSKASRPGGDSNLQKASSNPTILTGGDKKLSALGDRKREATSLLPPAVAPKKPKILSQGQTFTPLGRPSERETDRRSSPVPPVSHVFEEYAIEVDSQMLLSEVLAAEDSCDDERLEGLLCGTVKHLHHNRSKPDQLVYLSLMHLAKMKPNIFNSEIIIEAFCSLLKRDMSLNFKSKGNSLVSVLACNVMMKAYSDEENWPDDFVKVYIDDALGERVWVDRSDCKGFADNIITAFNTNLPKGGLTFLEGKTEQGAASPAVSGAGDEEESKMEVDIEKSSSNVGEVHNVPVYQRFPYQIDNIETFVMEIVREQLLKRQLMDASAKSLIRLMTVTCGYGEVRPLAAQKLELWLQNPKLARAAQELLMSVCMNCNQHDASDMEAISFLIKMRMKTKPLNNHYLNCIRELLAQHPDNLRMVLTHTIYNELSTARNPNNMALIGVVFQTKNDGAARILAEIFQELLVNKDDYLRALRALFREIVRSLRHDLNFSAFALAMMQERTEQKFTEMDQAYRERYLLCIIDLVTLCILQTITPAVREAVTAIARGDRKDVEVLHNFQSLVATIQRDGIWWLHTVVPKFIEAKQQEYVFCIKKLLFMETIDHYTKDNWPAESDKGPMLRLAMECPVLEDTLMRLLVIGLSRELPLTPADAIDFVDILVRRAANLSGEGRVVISVERLELFDALLNLCAYKHPANTVLPEGYTPPQLAISNLYWKGWIILLIISAFNPATFGLAAWDNYPTLKCMIEMVMTNNYRFPPPTTAADDSLIEDVRNQEIQVARKEKQEILEFEGYLAASTSKVTITESNSLLIAQLTSMQPNGTARKPPQHVMDQLRTLNDTMKIGQMLCRSRNPDFLLDIIQRQGTSQSMPWLAELVESSEGSLDVLPVQCLCEFLLHETQDTSRDMVDDESAKFEKHKKKQKLKKQQQLLSRLQALVHNAESDSSTTHEVIDYFLKRLSSTQAANRALATKGLSMIVSRSQLSPMDETPHDIDDVNRHTWLLSHMPALPMFPQVKQKICTALRQAIQIESDASLVSAYIIFLSQHSSDQTLQELDELSLDIAQLIVERTTIVNYMLPMDQDLMSAVSLDTLQALIKLFLNYLRKAKEQNTEGYSWSNTQDQIILQWESGDSATMHILVTHAMIILLSYGPAHDKDDYKELLDTWFPEKAKPPSAFLLDTSEEALLLPDWLKLRMIRSSAEPLISAALQDLESCQLLLFVQSFGIPVHSMSHLLRCLDNAVTVDISSLEQAVVDKAYMAQLIEVQHKRGATGGEKFYSMLTDGATLSMGKADQEMEVEKSDDTAWKCRSPDVAMEMVPASHVVNTLLQAFDSSGRKVPDSETHFRSLITSVSKKSSGALDIVKGLHQIVNGSSGAEFAKTINKSTKACSLLKLSMAKQKEPGVQLGLTQVFEKLLQLYEGQRSPVASIAQQYLLTRRKQEQKSKQTKPQLTVNDEKQFVEDLAQLTSADCSKTESLIRTCMKSSMESRSRSHGAKLACTVLLQNQAQQNTDGMLASTAALFVDWLELLDPEVIRQVPELQEKLLFARQTVSQTTAGSGVLQATQRSSQPYLLALLTHQSSWSTLHRCIESLLSDSQRGEFSPVAVLDFLWACIHIPKIWQGRERKVPKNQSPEDVLGLKNPQLASLVDYIIREATSLLQPSNPDSSATPVTINNRMELLTCCLCNNTEKVKYLVNHLEMMMSAKCDEGRLYETLLIELYLQYPYLLSWLSNSQCVTSDTHSTHRSQTQMDMITHRLITNLYQAGRSKKHDNRMADVNIACRKLASEHPILVLRQLPAIVALLKGKTEFVFYEFRQRNLLSLYSYVLGILDLLQPAIFQENGTTLHDILEEYFNLIKAYLVHKKQLGPIIVKLVTLLNQYISHDTHRATTLLQKYVEFLGIVSVHYPDLSILKSLLAGLSLPRHNQGEQPQPTEESTMVMHPVRPSSPWSVSYLAPFLQKIRKDNSEDVLMVLRDLDETSKRKIDILGHFVDELKKLLLASNDVCRNTAYDLVKRHIKNNPKQASDFVPTYLHCLESSNPDIVTSALVNLAEFTILCQDSSDVILQKAFTVGINTSLETSSYISESLQLLNLDLACT